MYFGVINMNKVNEWIVSLACRCLAKQPAGVHVKWTVFIGTVTGLTILKSLI